MNILIFFLNVLTFPIQKLIILPWNLLLFLFVLNYITLPPWESLFTKFVSTTNKKVLNHAKHEFSFFITKKNPKQLKIVIFPCCCRTFCILVDVGVSYTLYAMVLVVHFYVKCRNRVKLFKIDFFFYQPKQFVHESLQIFGYAAEFKPMNKLLFVLIQIIKSW